VNAYEWWQNELAADRAAGRSDADKGVYNPPYPGSDDPGDQDQNSAYHEGFQARRHELGSKFEWVTG
jgi:hypothetical protein